MTILARYTYDAKSRLIKEETISKKGLLQYFKTYSYRGDTVVKQYYSLPDEENSTTRNNWALTYEEAYLTKQPTLMLWQKRYRKGKPELWHAYSFDAKGRKLLDRQYAQDSMLFCSESWVYAENGKELYYRKEGKCAEYMYNKSEEIRNTYNVQGMLVKSKYCRVSFNKDTPINGRTYCRTTLKRYEGNNLLESTTRESDSSIRHHELMRYDTAGRQIWREVRPNYEPDSTKEEKAYNEKGLITFYRFAQRNKTRTSRWEYENYP